MSNMNLFVHFESRQSTFNVHCKIVNTKFITIA